MKQVSTKSEYFIKPGYVPRVKNLYYSDFADAGILWQPDVYRLAAFLAEKTDARYIIDIGSGSGEKLLPFIKKYKIIAVDFGDNLKLIKKVIGKKHTFIDQNFEKNFPPLEKEILRRSIVICSDVIEHIVKPDKLLSGLLDMAETAPYVLVSTPDRVRTWGIPHFGPPPNEAHVREWNLEELHALFKDWGFSQFLFGRTLSNNISNSKATSLIIAGTQSAPHKSKGIAKLVVSVKQGVKSSTIDYYVSQGCIVALDDGEQYHLYINSSEKAAATCSRNQKSLIQELSRKRIKSHWSFECHNNARVTTIDSQNSLAEHIKWIDSLGFNEIKLRSLHMQKDTFKLVDDARRITKTPGASKKRNSFAYPLLVEDDKTTKPSRKLFKAKPEGIQGPSTPDFLQDYLVEILTGVTYQEG